MKIFFKTQLSKSIVPVVVILLFNPILTFAATDTKAKPKAPDKTLKKDVVCPESKDVAMMGGMGGMGTGTGGMGGMGGMGTGGTQGTLGGMGTGGMGTGTGGMGTMSGMGNMAAVTESEDKTLAPKGALSHSPCSKDNTDNGKQ